MSRFGTAESELKIPLKTEEPLTIGSTAPDRKKHRERFDLRKLFRVYPRQRRNTFPYHFTRVRRRKGFIVS